MLYISLITGCSPLSAFGTVPDLEFFMKPDYAELLEALDDLRFEVDCLDTTSEDKTHLKAARDKAESIILKAKGFKK